MSRPVLLPRSTEFQVPSKCHIGLRRRRGITKNGTKDSARRGARQKAKLLMEDDDDANEIRVSRAADAIRQCRGLHLDLPL